MKNKMDTKAPRCYGGALFFKVVWSQMMIIKDLRMPFHQNQSLGDLEFCP